MRTHRQRRKQMPRTLLAERFQLRVHWESREMPVCALLVDKNGSMLRAPRPQGARMVGRRTQEIPWGWR